MGKNTANNQMVEFVIEGRLHLMLEWLNDMFQTTQDVINEATLANNFQIKMNEDIMKNHREGILEDRAYRAAIFFKNITRDSLKETIRGSKILHISKKRNMEIPKRLYENEAQTKNRRF